MVIPVREAAVTFTQQEYNYMLVGVFELIAAKQAEYDSYQEYLEAVRDYWIARAQLEHAIGGNPGRTTRAAPPSDGESSKHEVHQHEGA